MYIYFVLTPFISFLLIEPLFWPSKFLSRWMKYHCMNVESRNISSTKLKRFIPYATSEKHFRNSCGLNEYYIYMYEYILYIYILFENSITQYFKLRIKTITYFHLWKKYCTYVASSQKQFIRMQNCTLKNSIAAIVII